MNILVKWFLVVLSLFCGVIFLQMTFIGKLLDYRKLIPILGIRISFPLILVILTFPFFLLGIPIFDAFLKSEEKNNALYLQYVPDGLEVNSVIYRIEDSWGFGPGGNEAGIRFYSLSTHVSHKIKKSGIDFFKQLLPNKLHKNREWRGIYSNWKETPITGESWKVDPKTGLLNVVDYICAYGFCVDIPPDRLKQVNDIISKPGSFYAYGRIGMIVVSPEENLVIYFYNG